jgi:hypothetical protein
MASQLQEPQKQTVELGSGTVMYMDTGGSGEVIVFLHGLLMDASLWRTVIDDLRSDYRCIAPTLPLGAHEIPMDPAADLSLPAIARLVSEFLGRLNLSDVTIQAAPLSNSSRLTASAFNRNVSVSSLARHSTTSHPDSPEKRSSRWANFRPHCSDS